MLTINSIIEEMKDVPLNRLEELYQLIQPLTPTNKFPKSKNKKILAFGGFLNNWTEKDYSDYSNYTKKLRENLFERDVTL